MKHALQHLHFVGIGGAGMSAIAELLHGQGYIVTGSDAAANDATGRLASMGIRVFSGHDAAQLGDAQAVVASSAIAASNPELAAARERGIPVVPRAVMLAELMRTRLGIAVAGTHGKTTTTSLVASVLMEGGADPGFVIGGQLQGLGLSARAGSGDALVVEADESDASFLHLRPLIAVVTNIDADHMETYGHDLQRLQDAFAAFLDQLPFYGRAIVCSDDAGVQALLPRLDRRALRYGLHDGADLRATDVRARPGSGMDFVAIQSGHPDLPLHLALAGEHNVANALAALAVARELHLPDEATARALARFAGVGRRFTRCGELELAAAAGGGHCTLIDDYGHHPAEMAAVLAAARGAFPARRLVLAFQPHRYTRTRDCLADFARVIAGFDAAVLTEVYAAGEAAIAGADGRALAAAVQRETGVAPLFAADLTALPAAVHTVLRGGDVLIMMGAGSIAELPARLQRGEGRPT